MPGIFDILQGVAVGGEQAIGDIEARGEREDQKRRQRVQDVMAQKLNQARLSDYQRRQQDALQADAEEKERKGQEDIEAADILHRYPDLGERYGTDFRPGGGARANIASILEDGRARTAREEEAKQREDFPEQFQREPTAPREPTDAQKFTAIARRAAEIADADPEITPEQAYTQASREYTQSTGGEVQPTEVEAGQQRIQQIQQGEYDWTAQDVEAAAADVQSREISLPELKQSLGITGSGTNLQGDEADIAFYLAVARNSNPAG